jgi:glycine/D-amino acid oxidase-like deaminating enzyme
MCIVARAIVVAAGVVGLVGSALAADMTGTEIKAFLSGKTAYVETTAASATGKAGQGVVYWAEDGTALYKTPTGVMWHGKWEIKGNTACTDWKEKPNNPCMSYDKTGDSYQRRERSDPRQGREDHRGQCREADALSVSATRPKLSASGTCDTLIARADRVVEQVTFVAKLPS